MKILENWKETWDEELGSMFHSLPSPVRSPGLGKLPTCPEHLPSLLRRQGLPKSLRHQPLGNTMIPIHIRNQSLLILISLTGPWAMPPTQSHCINTSYSNTEPIVTSEWQLMSLTVQIRRLKFCAVL